MAQDEPRISELLRVSEAPASVANLTLRVLLVLIRSGRVHQYEALRRTVIIQLPLEMSIHDAEDDAQETTASTDILRIPFMSLLPRNILLTIKSKCL